MKAHRRNRGDGEVEGRVANLDDVEGAKTRPQRRLQREATNLAAADAGLLSPDGPLIVVRDQQPRYGGKPQRGGELRVPRPAMSVDDFNPAAFSMDPQVAASYLDPLLRADPRSLAPTPWLAESWEVAAGGEAVTYRLRDDVRWHDGTSLTAADVAFSLEVYRDDPVSAVANFFSRMQTVEAVDDRTVEVSLSANDPTWLFNASTLPIVQRDQYEAFWTSRPAGERTLAGFDWRASPPVGSGPWRIENWNGNSVDFSAVADHPLAAPWFARLVIDWTQNRGERLEGWRRGEADIIWPLRLEEVNRLGDRPARVYAADAASVMFAAFNFANPLSPIAGVFDDLRVRRALSLALDRAAYVESVFGGFANATAVGTVAQPWAHDGDLASPRRDPAQAVALLNEAGWFDYNGDGFLERADGFPLALTLIHSAEARPELARVLARVQLDLEAIGVDFVVEGLSPDVFRERWSTAHDYDLIAYAFDLFPGFTDIDLYGSRWDVRRNVFGWNPGGYSNQTVDEAINAYLGSDDLDAQRGALFDLQRATDEDLFGLWLGFPQDLIAVSADVLGFQPDMGWQTAATWALWRESSMET
jgi:peptide/nickel transport system substrate-binding protein